MGLEPGIECATVCNIALQLHCIFPFEFKVGCVPPALYLTAGSLSMGALCQGGDLCLGGLYPVGLYSADSLPPSPRTQ